jgi:uncharacterized protein with predicted RNA binding PUA domain
MKSLQISHLKRIRTIADFQFGKDAGAILFPDDTEFRLSSTKRVRYAELAGERLATLRAHDGRLTLSIAGAKRLLKALYPPAYRVSVDPAVEAFVMEGRNAMAKHIIAADPGIRAGDEVVVVDTMDRPLATGSAVLSGTEMLAFNYGVAVNVRKGSK